MRLYQKIALCFGLLWSVPAHADLLLPWLSDPLGSEEKMQPYVSNERLRPASCPTIPDKDYKLAIGEVVVLSLCNNPDLLAAYLTLASEADSTVSAYSAYFPTIGAEAGLTRSRSLPSGTTDISRSSGLSASWDLYDFGQRELTIESTELSMIAAGHSYSTTLQTAISTALQGYYSLLTAQNGVAIAEESERYAKSSYDAAKLRHEIGQVALADELQAKGSYSQSVLSTQSAKKTLATEKAAMARLLGLNPDAEITVAEIDDTSLTLEPFNGKLPQLIAEAKQKRLDLQSERLSLQTAKIALKQTKRQNLASVSVSTSAGMDSNRFLRGGSTRSGSIGVSVSVPIFSGFANTYSERAAERSVKQQEIALEQAELDVEQEVWNAWHSYQTAQLSWDTSFDSLQSATLLKDIALARYKEGLGTILDVLNAQSQYNSALESHLQVRYSLLTSRIDLVRTVGVLDLETMKPETTLSLPETLQDAPLPTPIIAPEQPAESETPTEPNPTSETHEDNH